MSNDIEFVDGLIVKAPHERAPEFVKASISIKVADLGVWLREKHKAGQEWVNVDVLVSKAGNWYTKVNTYKKEHSENDKARGQEVAAENAARRKGGSIVDIDSDIPFASCSLGDDRTFKRLRWLAE